MADTMQFDLVSPERSLASLEVTEARVPGTEGDMTAMPGHMPVITTLRPGVVSVVSGSESSEYVVTNGFVEVTATSVSVIAEKAFARTEANRDELNAVLEDARAAAADVGEDQRDAAERFVADMVQLLEDME
ncbi:MAG: F0F1 ATP synthase subunit epsilon [Brevirhabdus sp.]